MSIFCCHLRWFCRCLYTRLWTASRIQHLTSLSIVFPFFKVHLTCKSICLQDKFQINFSLADAFKTQWTFKKFGPNPCIDSFYTCCNRNNYFSSLVLNKKGLGNESSVSVWTNDRRAGLASIIKQACIHWHKQERKQFLLNSYGNAIL